MENFYTRKVYYYETDRMQIVHHSNYIRWFEEARVFFFDQIGLKYSDLEKMGLWLPLVDSHCNYKSALKYDERFYIDAKLAEYNGCKMKLEYTVYKSDKKEIAATGYTDHVFTTPELKIIRINKKFTDIHKKLLDLLEK